MGNRRQTTVCARALLLLAAALLLFAQQVGLSHAVWHAVQKRPQHAELAIKAGGTVPSLPHASKLCPLDAVLGQVLGAAPVTTYAFHPAVLAQPAVSCDMPALRATQAFTARSRGPPALH